MLKHNGSFLPLSLSALSSKVEPHNRKLLCIIFYYASFPLYNDLSFSSKVCIKIYETKKRHRRKTHEIVMLLAPLNMSAGACSLLETIFTWKREKSSHCQPLRCEPRLMKGCTAVRCHNNTGMSCVLSSDHLHINYHAGGGVCVCPEPRSCVIVKLPRVLFLLLAHRHSRHFSTARRTEGRRELTVWERCMLYSSSFRHFKDKNRDSAILSRLMQKLSPTALVLGKCT